MKGNKTPITAFHDRSSDHTPFDYNCLTCYPILSKYAKMFDVEQQKRKKLRKTVNDVRLSLIDKSNKTYDEINDNKHKFKTLTKQSKIDSKAKSVGRLLNKASSRDDKNLRYLETVVDNTFNMKINKRELSELEITNDMLSHAEIFYDFTDAYGDIYTLSSHQICNLLKFRGDRLLINEAFKKSTNKFKHFYYEYSIDNKKYYVQRTVEKYNKYFLYKNDWHWVYNSTVQLERVSEGKYAEVIVINRDSVPILPAEFYDKYRLYFATGKVSYSIIPSDFTYVQEGFGFDHEV